MVGRWLLTASVVFGAGVFGAGAAMAKDPGSDGVPIQVTVVDVEGKPISTAVVRHPEEADRHRVNSLTGVWEAEILYLPDGSELVFTPGTTLTLEVSAPGYMTQIIQYDVRKRRNRIEVLLPVLDIDETGIDEPLIQFGRDKPRE